MKHDMEQKPFWWVNPKYMLPKTEENVLAIVNGSTKSIHFEKATMLAYYDADDGWIIEGFEELENVEVLTWAKIPARPKLNDDDDSLKGQMNIFDFLNKDK